MCKEATDTDPGDTTRDSSSLCAPALQMVSKDNQQDQRVAGVLQGCHTALVGLLHGRFRVVSTVGPASLQLKMKNECNEPSASC